MRKVYFGHGLGDCVHFAHQLTLYRRRGHELSVACSPDKAILFKPCGVEVTSDATDAAPVPWHEGSQPDGQLRWNNCWRWSKMAGNISTPPLPYIGSSEELWQEYCDVRLDVRPFLSREAVQTVRAFMEGLPRPVILLHTHGNTDANRKNVPNDLCIELYKRLIDSNDGTIILLDWDDRAPRLAHWRIRHITDDWSWLNTEQLLALIDRVDLLIGIDSGPLHASRYTDTRAIGLWMNGGCPVTWALPRPSQVNLVVGSKSRAWTRHARIPFHIIDCPDEARVATEVVKTAERLLAPARYLSECRIGADVQLQQFVLDWQRGDGSALQGYVDRHKSVDLLLRTISERFPTPLIVETGCLRSDDDFSGAGFSTYVLGAYVHSRGGRLISVDNSAAHCAVATAWTQCFEESVSVVLSDSIAWLSSFEQPIDVLFLDSLDTESAESADHGLCEIKAGYSRLHQRSLVVYDDTVYAQRCFRGKGALGVPWLLEAGWRILYSGHQTILSRDA